MKKSLFNKSAVALAAGLLAACAAQAYVVGPTAAPTVNTVAAATDFEINPGGIGHQLFVPYYSAQNGNQTYLTLTNTDMRNGKAVKVRFRGASNSDDVLDFTVFLSPGDAWTALVSSAGPNNPARLNTVLNDRTCTYPPLPVAGEEFKTFRLHPHLTPAILASETREGYVEIFNMADIPPLYENSITAVDATSGLPTATVAPTTGVPSTFPNQLYRAIEHVAGVPRNCTATAITNLQSVTTTPLNTVYGAAGNNNSAVARGLAVPTTGLMANWAIVSSTGRSWSGAATAVQALTAAGAAGVPGYGNIVFHPQTGDFVEGSANQTPTITRQRTADPLLRGGVANNNGVAAAPGAQSIDPLAVDLPDMSTPYLNSMIQVAADLTTGRSTRRQAQHLTLALSATSVSNEVLTFDTARTDWSFTFPTRRYNVARAYTTAAGGNEGNGSTVYTDYRNDDTPAAIAAAAPFLAGQNFFNPTNVVSDTFVTRRHQLCVTGISLVGTVKPAVEGTASRIGGVTGDRDETFQGAGGGQIVFSPAPPGGVLSFCGEVGVFSYNRDSQPTGVLNAQVAPRNISTGSTFGWVRFATPGLAGAGLPSTGTNLGLPVVGFAFQTYDAVSVSLPHRNTKP